MSAIVVKGWDLSATRSTLVPHAFNEAGTAICRRTIRRDPSERLLTLDEVHRSTVLQTPCMNCTRKIEAQAAQAQPEPATDVVQPQSAVQADGTTCMPQPLTTLPAGPVLVLAPVGTDAQRDDADGLAFDVCDQLCTASVVATSLDFNVGNFSAVYLDVDALSDWVATVLWTEALAAGVPVLRALPPDLRGTCDACGFWLYIHAERNEFGEVFCRDCHTASSCTWCGGTDMKPEPTRTAEGWSPMCKPCGREQHRNAA